MQDSGQKKVNEIIYNILSERTEDFQWSCNYPSFDTCDEFDIEDTNEQITDEDDNNPIIATLQRIRNLGDSIQNNIINSNMTEDTFLLMELMEAENKLKSINDTLNSLMNYSNNQAIGGQPQILTGDIILQ